MHAVAIGLTVLFLLSGCAAGARIAEVPRGAEGAAAPGPDLVGTWRGTAFAVPGGHYGTATAVEITVEPDGTWRWVKRGEEQARGRVRVRGDRVFLVEDVAKDGAQTIQLSRRGGTLWGVSRAFIVGYPAAIDLKKDAS
jgi:hypothetical protein